jgi:hypothetical protein
MTSNSDLPPKLDRSQKHFGMLSRFAAVMMFVGVAAVAVGLIAVVAAIASGAGIGYVLSAAGAAAIGAVLTLSAGGVKVLIAIEAHLRGR